MSELRQDPITRDWVILAPDRAHRPEERGAGNAACPFCPGNERLIPSAIDTIDAADGRWLVQALPNKFPALEPDAAELVATDAWRSIGGFGHHEVIVETPEHDTTLGLMPVEQVRQVIRMYARRYRALAEADPRLRQIVIFRNHGPRAGTSLAHPHSQVVAIPAVSPETRRRMADEIEFFDETGQCGLCHVIGQERLAGKRIVLETEAFVTVAPFASRGPSHLQVVPRRHAASFLDAEPQELDDLGEHLTLVMRALHEALDDPDYNLVVATPPLDLVHRAANHWFVDILPRLTTPAGFELGARIVINVRTPEAAAAALRARLREHPGAG